MRTLRIEKSGNIIVGDYLFDINKVENKSEFLMSILNLDIELEDNINVLDVVHFFYDAKTLIKNMLSEDYEVVRSLVNSTNISKNCVNLRVYKSFRLENEPTTDEEFLYLIPEVEISTSDLKDNNIKSLGELPIFIDERIKLNYKPDVENGVVIYSKTKITLLDLMISIFDELPNLIKDGFLLSI